MDGIYLDTLMFRVVTEESFVIGILANVKYSVEIVFGFYLSSVVYFLDK